MSDREKVIKGLGEISDYFFSVYCRSKDREEIIKAKNRGDSIEDAITMLKEQEAIKIEVKKINDNGRCGRCPNCLIELNETDYPNYCGFCGRSVKWE